MDDEKLRPKRQIEEDIHYIAPRTETDIMHERKDECRKWICLYKKMNFLDGKYRMDRINIQSYLESFFTELHWLPAKDKAFAYCLWNTRRITRKYEPCKPKALNICLEGILFKNCPTEAWNNSTKCNMLKQFFDECILIENKFSNMKYSVLFEYVK